MAALHPPVPAGMKVALLTSGGLAPCLSAACGYLIEKVSKHSLAERKILCGWPCCHSSGPMLQLAPPPPPLALRLLAPRACVLMSLLFPGQYNNIDPNIEIICYKGGYKGLLSGDFITVDALARKTASVLVASGGSPIGNSRVKLTNVADCVKRGLVKEGEMPLEVAAKQLMKDGVTVLHTIGGDDTNTQAAKVSEFLKTNGYTVTVVGLPKTIDNDVVPIRQSLGAWTAAEQGAVFFENVVNESSANPRMLIIHECMGRDCGYLTAATALSYRQRLGDQWFIEELGFMKVTQTNAMKVPRGARRERERCDAKRGGGEGPATALCLRRRSFEKSPTPSPSFCWWLGPRGVGGGAGEALTNT